MPVTKKINKYESSELLTQRKYNIIKCSFVLLCALEPWWPVTVKIFSHKDSKTPKEITRFYDSIYYDEVVITNSFPIFRSGVLKLHSSK